MTTIIVDRKNKMMISDLQTTSGDLTYPTERKIHRLKRGNKECLVGTCCTVDDINVFMKWFLRNWYKPVYRREPPPDSKTDAIIVVLYSDGTVEEYYNSWYPEPVVMPVMAYGSGRELALGAILAGASAEQAMKIACTYDRNTGMGIQLEQIDKRYEKRSSDKVNLRRNR